MSEYRHAAKDAATSDDVHSTALDQTAGQSDRNKFFTSEQCSCIVLNPSGNGRNLMKEPYNTEKESAAMDTTKQDFESAASVKMAEYLSHIAHLDMPLAAKIEMVEALRQIMASFVEAAHGDDPIQHVHEMHADDEKRIPDVVSSGNTPSDKKASLSSASVSPASGKERKERP